MSFVNGRPVIDATMQRALARQAGYRVTVSDASATSATVTVSEQGEVIGSASFTIADAKAAGLTGKENWKNYAEDMLVALGHDQGDTALRSGRDGRAVHRGRDRGRQEGRGPVGGRAG